jgi:hypothetical protein
MPYSLIEYIPDADNYDILLAWKSSYLTSYKEIYEGQDWYITDV